MTTSPSGRPRGRPPYDGLTPAEERVLQHLRRGRTNGEIAEQLGVTLDAVKYHVSNMLGKLGLESREQLAALPAGGRWRSAWGGLPLLAKLGLGGAAAGVAALAVAVPLGVGNPAPSDPPVLFDGLVTAPVDGKPVHFQSGRPSLSADGRYVVFESNAPNLVKDDTNDATDIFRFDRQEQRIELVSDAAPTVWAGYPTMTADGRYVAFVASSGNPFYYPVRVKDMKTGNVREFASGAGPAISPDGKFLAYVVNETPGEQWPRGRIEVLELQSKTVVWTTPVSSEDQPLLFGGTMQFSADSRWFTFMGGNVQGATCDELLRPIISDGVEKLVPVIRPFVHDFGTGSTSCAPLPLVDGAVVGDVSFASISGDNLAVTYMSVTEATSASVPRRILGAHVALVSLASGEVTTFDSTDLTFCCGGPPALAGTTLVWGAHRKTGMDLFEPFPTAGTIPVVRPTRFDPDSVTYSEPALSADGRHLAYVVKGWDLTSGSAATEIYVVTR